MLTILSATINACTNQTKETDDTPLIQKTIPTIENGRMTPEVLWSFGRLGGVEVSPDGQKIVYTVSYYSKEQNRSNTEIFVMDIDGQNKKQLTRSNYQEVAPKWSNDSEHIAFLTNESGTMQVWTMDQEGKNRKQLTQKEGGIQDFKFSPNEKKILYIANVKYGTRTADTYPDLPQATGIIVNDLMYKHWDEWVETVPHPFVANVQDGKITNEKDLLEGEPYESPMKPFGGIEQLAWSTDGKMIAYTCRKKTGLDYAVSTNSDIYFYHIETGKTENKTEGMMGYDQNPTFSPDGKWMAWESMEHDGYESDKNRLMLLNLETNKKIELTDGFDQSASALSWDTDSQSIYFISTWHGTTHIYNTPLQPDGITQITEGDCEYDLVSPLQNGQLITLKHSFSKPNEIYAFDTKTKSETELSLENKEILKQITMGKVEARWMTTTDNKQLHAWVIYPPNFDPNKKYPTLLYCGGGPQSSISQFWSYRWNFQMMAANDYIIIAPNRRGVPGFGYEWLTQISGDYGGQNMQDYLTAIDHISTEPYVDKDRLGCVGASYGGFSVYWLAGHHNKRFKAFIAHDGMFNFPQQYLETEEMWFVNWDLGGAYWEKNNPTVQKSYAASPHLFVDKWDTPILVIHGEKDYRILASQGMAAFNAAVLRGVPAELLIYPDENHWVLKPQNGILWQRTYFNWLDKWLKK